MSPRMPRRSRVLVLLAAGAMALASLPACGDDGAPPADAPATKPPPEQATYPIRHLFIEARDKPRSPTRPARSRDEALTIARATVERLRAPGADFVAIAREVSDDEMTAAGDAFGGFRSHWSGDDPALVDAVAKLAVGAVSDPVPAPAGFHVLQRLSREEGKALEARLIVPMEGLLFRWVELDPVPEPRRTKAEAYAEAADAAMKLRGGADVERMSLELQNVRNFALPMRAKGLAGWDAFIEAAYAAQVGQWVGPVETADGWAVARRLPYVRAGVRHLVVTHRKSPGPSRRDRSPEDAEAIAQRALERLDAEPGSWSRVVAELSDEPGSKAVDGYLGDFSTTAEPRWRMAPEIQQELLAMQPGERSKQVFPSRFGFHIFWRLD